VYNDPSQQQGSFPVPGFPGTQEPLEGPLGDLQGQVASVLNGNGDGNTIFVSAGPAEPVFQIPNIRVPIVNFFRRLVRW
jgi:hypothetical protein